MSASSRFKALTDHICYQEEVLAKISQHPDSVLANNPEMMKKFMSKYYHKFSSRY